MQNTTRLERCACGDGWVDGGDMGEMTGGIMGGMKQQLSFV